MIFSRARLLVLVALIQSVATPLLLGQETSWITTNASIGLSSDFYSQSGMLSSRLPSSVHRASVNVSLRLFDQIELPFSAYISTLDAGYNQPFNQFGVSPRIGNWLRLHAGYFSARTSELTVGDVRMLGGGVEVTPGNFNASVYYGQSVEARNPVPQSGFYGAYDRRLIAAKLGYGSESNTGVSLNFMYAKDDPASMQRDTLSPLPFENLVGSLQFSTSAFDRVINFRTEVAGSVFSNDNTAQTNDEINQIPQFYTATIATQVDVAARAALQVVPSQYWDVSFNAQWIGPGYVTLGFAQLTNDVLDLTVQPTLKLFENALYLRGQIGTRTNNLRQTRSDATTRTIGSLSANMQFSNAIGMDVQYANYGMRSTHQNDSIRLQNISQIMSISPRVQFEFAEAQNIVSLSASLQDVEDKNPWIQTATKNKTLSLSFVHSMIFPSSLSLTTTAFNNTVETSFVNTKITNISETVGYALFEKLLSLNGTAGISLVQAVSNSTQFLGRISATLNLQTYGAFTLQVMTNNNSYADASTTPPSSELQGGLQYAINF